MAEVMVGGVTPAAGTVDGPAFVTGPPVGPGWLVTFDGFDGSGKSTLVRRLVQELRAAGRPAKRVRTPTPQFRRSRMFVLLAKQGRLDMVDPLALQVAHAADRLQLVRRTVVPALESGCDVVVDRYLTGAYNALARWDMLPAPWFHDLVGHMPTPALSVYLHVRYDRWHERMISRAVRDRTECAEADYRRHICQGLDTARRNRMLILDTSDLSITDCMKMVKAALPEAATPI